MASPQHSKPQFTHPPTDTVQPSNLPTANRLVNHLIAAKRSLSATSQVYRANEIIPHARTCVEEITALSAKNAFLEHGIQRHLKTAVRVRRGLEQVKENGAEDFKDVLSRLDAANDRMNWTLKLLKTTFVESSLQAPVQADVQTSSQPSEESIHDLPTTRKSLYDFVSEQGVETLTAYFHARIDATNAAKSTFEDSFALFDAELRAIEGLLPSRDRTALGPAETDNTAIVSLFQSLEGHANDTAEGLQSLVQHYDLCVTALKHTEGGGEAAAEKAQVDIDASIRADGAHSLPEPISQEERAEMLDVLEKDATEVEEVVLEISEHVRDMEAELDQIIGRMERARTEGSRLVKAITLLDQLGSKLPAFIDAGQTFRVQWLEQKEQIEEKMQELEGAHDFYETFLTAYDQMILEVGRRRSVRSKMEKIASEAKARMQKLHDEDSESRQYFRDEYGDYLPSDLWPGLINAPAKYDIVANHSDDYIPDISKETTRGAMERRGKTK